LKKLCLKILFYIMEETLFSFDSQKTVLRKAMIHPRPGIAAEQEIPVWAEDRNILVVTYLSPDCEPCHRKPVVRKIAASQYDVQGSPVLVRDILKTRGMTKGNHLK